MRQNRPAADAARSTAGEQMKGSRSRRKQYWIAAVVIIVAVALIVAGVRRRAKANVSSRDAESKPIPEQHHAALDSQNAAVNAEATDHQIAVVEGQHG